MKIQAMMYPWAFIEDENGNIIGRYHIDRDFNNSPVPGATVEENADNGKWDVKSNNSNENCVGGVCPVR